MPDALAATASDLELYGVGVRYGTAVAVDDVSLHVPSGQITALVGPNGSGKSSTLRAVCGVTPHSGDITVAGASLEGRSLRARHGLGIAMVPQGRQLFADMTVEDNLRIVADLHRRSRSAVEEGLSYFPVLQQRRRSFAGVLSGGQQQMLALSRAMITRPRVLLLDEPVDGLAAGTVGELLTAIRTLADDGVAVLIAEPTIGSIRASVDRGYVLLRGRVRAAAETAIALEHAYAHELGVSEAIEPHQIEPPPIEPSPIEPSTGVPG